MDGNQLDSVMTWLLYGAMAGAAVALLLYIVAVAGRRSARTAGILAALCASLYVGAGVVGAAARVERGASVEAPAVGSSSPGEPGSDASDAEQADERRAVEEAAASLSRAVAGADWAAATTAHEALRALDPSHPDLAPALAKIAEGRANAAADSDGDPNAADDAEPAANDAEPADDDAEPAADDAEPAAAVERRSRAKRRARRRRRRPPRDPDLGDGDDGGDDGGDDVAPDEPATPEPKQEREPKPEPPPPAAEPDVPEPG